MEDAARQRDVATHRIRNDLRASCEARGMAAQSDKRSRARRWRCAMILALGLCVAGPARAQPAPAQPSAAARALAALPAEIAGLRRVGTLIDFEQHAEGAGFGAAAEYVPVEQGGQVAVTVYAYDRGRRRAPEGAGSPEVLEELRIAAHEVQAAVRLGRYAGATFETETTEGDPGRPASLRCLNFRLRHEDGVTADSVCVTIRRGMFLKLRLTHHESEDPAVAGEAAAGLLAALLKARGAQPGGGRS